MLVPLLKKKNDNQKHFVKVEILSILHNAKRYRPEYQTSQTQFCSASEPSRYDRNPYPKDSRRRMSSARSNYIPSPLSTSGSPTYVMSPSPSTNQPIKLQLQGIRQ